MSLYLMNSVILPEQIIWKHWTWIKCQHIFCTPDVVTGDVRLAMAVVSNTAVHNIVGRLDYLFFIYWRLACITRKQLNSVIMSIQREEFP